VLVNNKSSVDVVFGTILAIFELIKRRTFQFCMEYNSIVDVSYMNLLRNRIIMCKNTKDI
jgi:hypothetical protein